ncbi:MAG: peptidoglycan DD-metalloendopeptidase family protein [bacterium]
MGRKEITFFIFGNYTSNALRFTISLNLARFLFFFLVLMTILLFFALGLVVSGAYRLSRTVYLTQRNRQLEKEFKKVTALKERLEFLENEREKLAKMLGVNLTPPPVDWQLGVPESASLPEWVKNQPWGNNPVPVLAPVTGYVISRGASPEHMAVDLACQKGSPVRAVADGLVVEKGVDKQFGRFILLRHEKGYESYYGHLETWLVQRGDTVKVGQTIGRVGMTGQASAPHLHLEIRKDTKPIDPAILLKL